MNTSVKGEYALQAIFDLASQRAGEPVRIADIARRQKIPQKFLELILAGGRRLRVPTGFDAATLRQALAVLEEEPRC